MPVELRGPSYLHVVRSHQWILLEAELQAEEDQAGWEMEVTNAAVFYLQILVWHTRTEKPVLVNEGKKGFTDPNVEI